MMHKRIYGVSLWLSRWAPLGYICFALPCVIFNCFALPPFQTADEANHFLRVVQLSQGQIIGERLSITEAGGTLDTKVAELTSRFDYLKFHPETKVDLPALAAARMVRWEHPQTGFVSFGNTVFNLPFSYLPAIAVVAIARSLNLTIIDTLYAARLSIGLTAILIGAIALHLCTFGKPFLFVLLSLPMTLSLDGSCSHDGLTIAYAALAVGVFCRSIDRPERSSFYLDAVFAGFIGLVISGRISYLPILMLIPPRIFVFKSHVTRNDLKRTAICMTIGLTPVLASLLMIAFIKVPLRPEDGVSISGQLAFLLHEPSAVLLIIRNTFGMFGKGYLIEFIGKLGWLDTILPRWTYIAAALAIALAILLSVSCNGRSLPRMARYLIVVSVLGTILLTFFLQYLSWTPVGTLFVDGFQGRYAIAPLVLLTLALPRLPETAGGHCRSDVARSYAIATGWALIGIFALSNIWSVPRAILIRYYG